MLAFLGFIRERMWNMVAVFCAICELSIPPATENDGFLPCVCGPMPLCSPALFFNAHYSGPDPFFNAHYFGPAPFFKAHYFSPASFFYIITISYIYEIFIFYFYTKFCFLDILTRPKAYITHSSAIYLNLILTGTFLTLTVKQSVKKWG